MSKKEINGTLPDYIGGSVGIGPNYIPFSALNVGDSVAYYSEGQYFYREWYAGRLPDGRHIMDSVTGRRYAPPESTAARANVRLQKAGAS